ncbi:MAG: 16S rRNA (guanine(966)-N(2))-methyltransferase RsmD [Bdellovibrionales bacterium]|nr:16S rRNA (guanine(966)-N(2))-methyltransferase RsmD [Bdellovibrionales bacterium]
MLKITGGDLRGRTVLTPPDDKTRPSGAKVRQALYNSIQMRTADARVLDLFAGSGALGFEALSRGARHVCFAENWKVALKCLDQNISTLKVKEQVQVIREDILSPAFNKKLDFEIQKDGLFDLVLADPPYADDWEMKLLNFFPWEKVMVPGGLFFLEWGAVKSKVESLPDQTPFLVKVREKNYGDTWLTTFERKS